MRTYREETIYEANIYMKDCPKAFLYCEYCETVRLFAEVNDGLRIEKDSTEFRCLTCLKMIRII